MITFKYSLYVLSLMDMKLHIRIFFSGFENKYWSPHSFAFKSSICHIFSILKKSNKPICHHFVCIDARKQMFSLKHHSRTTIFWNKFWIVKRSICILCALSSTLFCCFAITLNPGFSTLKKWLNDFFKSQWQESLIN